jgi:hypothetical protein
MTAPTTAARSFTVTISPVGPAPAVPETFAKMTGGESTAEVTKNWNGGALVPNVTAGRATYANLVLDRPFGATRDRPIARALAPLVGKARYTIVKQDLDAYDMAVGAPTVWTNAVLVRVSEPDYDETSSAGATLTLEFMPENRT